MSYPTLRRLLDALDKAGELHRITAEVSPMLEVTEIADRVSKSPAPTASSNAQPLDPRHAHLGGTIFSNKQSRLSMPCSDN